MAKKTTIDDLKNLKEVQQAEVPAAAEAAPVQSNQPIVRVKKVDAKGRAYGTGRRKDAVARVWLKPGSGKVIVNERDQSVYFARHTHRPRSRAER